MKKLLAVCAVAAVSMLGFAGASRAADHACMGPVDTGCTHSYTDDQGARHDDTCEVWVDVNGSDAPLPRCHNPL